MAIRHAIRRFGPDNQTVVLFESLMDSKSLFLTANTESVHAWSWLNLQAAHDLRVAEIASAKRIGREIAPART